MKEKGKAGLTLSRLPPVWLKMPTMVGRKAAFTKTLPDNTTSSQIQVAPLEVISAAAAGANAQGDGGHRIGATALGEDAGASVADDFN